MNTKKDTKRKDKKSKNLLKVSFNMFMKAAYRQRIGWLKKNQYSGFKKELFLTLTQTCSEFNFAALMVTFIYFDYFFLKM